MKKFCNFVTTATQICVIVSLVVACAPDQGINHELDTSLVQNVEGAVSEKSLTPTVYFIKLINLQNQDCTTKKTIYDVNHKPIVQVCANTYKNCVIEGTCALVDGPVQVESTHETESSIDLKLINYVQIKKGVPLFQKVDTSRCPYGYGVKAICLDPFYSIAADLTHHKAGDVIFVPDVVGAALPNGERHSGYFIIRDKGGAIKGANRFDFFTGFFDDRNAKNPFKLLGLNDKKNKIIYKKIQGEEAESFRKRRTFPLVPF